MEHAEHIDSLPFVEVQQHVFADDQAEPLPDGPQREQIAMRERDFRPDFRHDLDEAGQGSGAEVFLDDLRRDAFHLMAGKNTRGDLAGKTRIDVRGMDLHVPEDVVGHPLAQQDGQRVRFGAMGAPASQA